MQYRASEQDTAFYEGNEARALSGFSQQQCVSTFKELDERGSEYIVRYGPQLLVA